MTALAGREARPEDELVDVGVAQAVELGLRRKPGLQGLAADLLGAQAASIVGDLDDDIAALLIGAELDPPGLRLAGRDPCGRGFEPVIGRVADHVGERVLDQLKHLPVELRLAAGHVELDLLVELERKLAHQPRQLLPGIGDRLHAGLHDALLQLGGDAGQALQRSLELAVAGVAHEIEQLIAGEHELAHRGHQMLERVDAHPHGLAARLRVDAGRFRVAFAGAGTARPPCRVQAPRARRASSSSSDTSPGGVRKGAQQRRPSPAGGSPVLAWLTASLQGTDEIGIGDRRLRAGALDLGQNVLDPVDAGEDDGDALDGDRGAVAILAHQRLGGMGKLGEPLQAKKPASAFDGVDQPEDGVEHLGIVGLLLETHELGGR